MKVREPALESFLCKTFVSYNHPKQRVVSTPDVGVQWELKQKATERGF